MLRPAVEEMVTNDGDKTDIDTQVSNTSTGDNLQTAAIAGKCAVRA